MTPDEWRENFIREIQRRWKIGRARAEAIYAKREARHADFQWYKVAELSPPDEQDESPEAR